MSSTTLPPTMEADQQNALSALFKVMGPHPSTVLAAAQAYADMRFVQDAEVASALWVGDWLKRREEWLRQLGELLNATQVAEISPTMRSTAAVNKARVENRLIAFEVGGRYFYPAVQFDADGVPADWVREVAAALPDTDTLLQFFAAGRKDLGGTSYARALAKRSPGRDMVATMVGEARAIAVAEAR